MSRGRRLYIKLNVVHCICRGVTGYTLNLVRFTVYVEGSQAIHLTWCGSLYMSGVTGYTLNLVRFTVYVEGSQAIH